MLQSARISASGPTPLAPLSTRPAQQRGDGLRYAPGHLADPHRSSRVGPVRRDPVDESAEGSGVEGVEPRGEQGAEQAAEHVPRAGRAHPRRGVGLAAHGRDGSGLTTRVCDPLSSTVQPVRSAASRAWASGHS